MFALVKTGSTRCFIPPKNFNYKKIA